MVAKSCSRSQGHPVPGVRSIAMISSRREISREGVMEHRSLLGRSGLYAACCAPIPAKRGERAALSTDWRRGLMVLMAAHERSIAKRDRPGAVFRRPGFGDLPRLGAGALCPRRNARLCLWPAPCRRTRMPRSPAVGDQILAGRLGHQTYHERAVLEEQ